MISKFDLKSASDDIKLIFVCDHGVEYQIPKELVNLTKPKSIESLN